MKRKHSFTSMDLDEFQLIADGFIDRSAHEFGEMPASSFFELLFERMAERVTETIVLEGEVVDNQLVLRLPVELGTCGGYLTHPPGFKVIGDNN